MSWILDACCAGLCLGVTGVNGGRGMLGLGGLERGNVSRGGRGCGVGVE